MIVALLAWMAQSGIPAEDIRGDWLNPRATAIIRIADCPSGLCGVIVWSASVARRDAARGGTADLNGTVVMSGFQFTGQSWRGRLFLPDLGRTVNATIVLRPNGKLQVRGCQMAGLICRTQIWTRR